MKISTTNEMNDFLKSNETATVVFPENASIFLVDIGLDTETKQGIEEIARSCRRSLHFIRSNRSRNKTY